MALATITLPDCELRRQRLAKLNAELHRRCTDRAWLARRIGLPNPNSSIYKILSGVMRTPDDFIENVCALTGIPLKAVLPPHEYEARRQALRDDMHDQDRERMGY